MAGAFLTSTDWIKLNELILMLGDEPGLSKFSHCLLQNLKHSISYSWANILFFHQHIQVPSKFVTYNIEKKTLINYENYYKHLDDIRKMTFDQPHPVKSTQVMDYKRWEKTEYFQDFLIPNQFYYLCGIDIHYTETLLATLTLIRNRGEEDFSEKNLVFLKVLAPHMGLQIARFFGLKKHQLWIDNFELTPRECEIVELIFQGATNQAIARKLLISVNTVKKHLPHIYDKCDVSSKLELLSKINIL